MWILRFWRIIIPGHWLYVSWWQTTNLNYLQQSTFMAFKSGVYITTPNTYYNLCVCGREGNCLFWSFHKILHETNVWFSVFKLLFLFARSNWKFRTVWSCDPNFRRNIPIGPFQITLLSFLSITFFDLSHSRKSLRPQLPSSYSYGKKFKYL